MQHTPASAGRRGSPLLASPGNSSGVGARRRISGWSLSREEEKVHVCHRRCHMWVESCKLRGFGAANLKNKDVSCLQKGRSRFGCRQGQKHVGSSVVGVCKVLLGPRVCVCVVQPGSSSRWDCQDYTAELRSRRKRRGEQGTNYICTLS